MIKPVTINGEVYTFGQGFHGKLGHDDIYTDPSHDNPGEYIPKK